VGLLAGAAVVAQAALLSRAVAAAFLGRAGLAAILPSLAAFAAVALVRALCGWLQELLAQRASAAVRLAVRDRAVRRLLAVGPRLGAGERTGELANTLVGGVEALDPYVAQYLPQSALAALVPLLVLAAVLGADPLSALVLGLTFPLVPLFTWLIGEAARASTRRQWLTLSRLSARFLDALSGLPTLRAFGRVEDEARQLEQAGERYRELTLRVLRLAFVSALVLEALATLATAVVAVEVGLRLLYARIGFGDALFVLVLAPEFYRPLRGLGAAFHAGMAGREAADRLAALLELPGPFAAPAILEPAFDEGAPEAAPTAGAPTPVRPAGSAPPRIRFDAVRLSYGARLAPALDGFSLDVPAGVTVALVGPTGAGKTTAAHVLLRFLEPAAGAVLVDGVPLATLAPEAWRARVAWVPQRPRLLEGTVRENLLLARRDASGSEIERALALAQLDGVVASLPLGLDTPIGESGERLSGGEAQRLALARAFLKDAPVLVLDEPTAQLDPETEDAVVDALARLRRGRTVLLVAHRLTTAAAADRVALVARGRVLEEGAPADLASSGSVYPRLLAAWGGVL
jgi:thiol reductant ABC exporter CydD subunit